jgi:hypothetical protein
LNSPGIDISPPPPAVLSPNKSRTLTPAPRRVTNIHTITPEPTPGHRWFRVKSLALKLQYLRENSRPLAMRIGSDQSRWTDQSCRRRFGGQRPAITPTSLAIHPIRYNADIDIDMTRNANTHPNTTFMFFIDHNDILTIGR